MNKFHLIKLVYTQKVKRIQEMEKEFLDRPKDTERMKKERNMGIIRLIIIGVGIILAFILESFLYTTY